MATLGFSFCEEKATRKAKNLIKLRKEGDWAEPTGPQLLHHFQS
jgi:hypothetical protein